MAYILLAIGALMALVGLAAMATGYPMIEIERGWATVITGAVLLSGGLVVAALGFVVRHLVGLRGALSVVGALPREVAAPLPQPEVAPMPLMPSIGAPAMPAVAPPPRHPLAPALGGGPALAAAVPAGAAVLAAGALHAHEAFESRPQALPLPEPTLEAPEAPPEIHAETPHVPETYVPEVELAEPTGTAHEAHPDAPAEAVAGAHLPRTDEDWLDQAFSAFDYEMTNGHPPPENTPAAAHETDTIVPAPAPEPLPVAATEAPPHEADAAEAPHEHAHDTHGDFRDDPPEGHPQDHPGAHPAEAEAHPPQDEARQDEAHHDEAHPPHDEAPATAPAEPAANLAVIGRYDSEGTSYVMYSDGSIEAQSEAGVYRFGSMAELKAFIEG